MFQPLLALGAVGLFTGLALFPNASPATAPGTPPATQAAYSIDAVHSSALFSATHFGVSRFYGRFNQVGGQITFDSEQPKNSSIRVEIAADSVDTHDKKRDQHLSGPDFFSAKEFKTLVFESESVRVLRKASEGQALQLEVKGKLAMVGKSREVTAVVDLVGMGKGMRGGELIGFHTRFTIKRSEWGMNFMVGPLSDEVEIILSVEANR